MSSRRQDDSTNLPPGEDERIDPLVLRALSRLGHRMPTTEQEVADLEAWAEQQPLSDRMKSRDALFGPRRGMPPRPVRAASPQFDESVDYLARAAREGGDIPPEVEERMQRDREQAENDDTQNGE